MEDTQSQDQFHTATERAFGKTAIPPVATVQDAPPEVAKTPEQIDAEKKLAEKPEEQPAAQPATTELTDEEFEVQLAKRTKGRIKSLSDLEEPAPAKTPEQIDAEKKEKKKNSLAWAISNDLIKQEDYDRSVVVGSKTDRELALELFAVDAKEIDPTLSVEDIEQRFQDHYREELDENDPIRKLQLKNMSKVAAAYRNEVSGKVSNVESNYDSFVTRGQEIKAFNKQVNAALKDELPKTIEFEFSYPHPDGTEHKIKLPYSIEDKIIESVRKEYVGNEAIYQALKGTGKEITNADIINAAMFNIRSNVFQSAVPILMSAAAKQARMDTEAHYKAIPMRRQEFSTEISTDNPDVKEKGRAFSKATQRAFTTNSN